MKPTLFQYRLKGHDAPLYWIYSDGRRSVLCSAWKSVIIVARDSDYDSQVSLSNFDRVTSPSKGNTP